MELYVVKNYQNHPGISCSFTLVAEDGHAPMRSCSPTEGMDEGCGIQPTSPIHITLPNAVVLSNNFWIDGLPLAVAGKMFDKLFLSDLDCRCTTACYGPK